MGKRVKSILLVAMNFAPGARFIRLMGRYPFLFRMQLRQLEGYLLCFAATIHDDKFLGPCIAFARLEALWLVHLATGGAPLTSAVLTGPAPRQLRMIPEHFIEDMCVILTVVGTHVPHLLDAKLTEDLIAFFCVFLGTPTLLNNPYVRAKMVDVLWSWLPKAHRQQHRIQSLWNPEYQLAQVFDSDLAIQALVPSLIRMYVDIENTDRHNQFYEKFGTRSKIGDVFEHLWGQPQHRKTWRAVRDVHVHREMSYHTMSQLTSCFSHHNIITKQVHHFVHFYRWNAMVRVRVRGRSRHVAVLSRALPSRALLCSLRTRRRRCTRPSFRG